MPELPEVETLRRTLARHLPGRQVRRVDVMRPGQIRHPDPETFRTAVTGRTFGDPQRRGKYLLLPLGGDRTLVCHLRMSGRLYVVSPEVPRATHTHVLFGLDDGTELRYEDQRTFGGFHLVGPGDEGAPEGLRTLGPEPLDPAWDPGRLAGALRGRRAPVKAVLLDQRAVAGLGNIYADEALFRAGIHPARPAGDLAGAEVVRLHRAVREVLADAIARRGTTFSLYLDGEARPGEFYSELRVYDREGEPCRRCGSPIAKIRVGGRGTHFCPRCQA